MPISYINSIEDAKIAIRVVKEAVDYLEELASTKTPVSVFRIKELHQILIQDFNREAAGHYRTEEVEIITKGSAKDITDSKKLSHSLDEEKVTLRHIPPHPVKLPSYMEAFNDWLEHFQEGLDDGGKQITVLRILKFATLVYHRLTFIHPFSDGNGRVARLAFNYVCRRYGLPYVVLKTSSYPPLRKAFDDADSFLEKSIKQYNGDLEKAFRQSDDSGMEKLYKVSGECIEESYEQLLAL